jgi:hypothetical protein
MNDFSLKGALLGARIASALKQLNDIEKSPRAYKAPKRTPSSKTKLKAIAAKQKKGRGKK